MAVEHGEARRQALLDALMVAEEVAGRLGDLSKYGANAVANEIRRLLRETR